MANDTDTLAALRTLTQSDVSARYIYNAVAPLNIAEGAKRSSKTYSWTLAFGLFARWQIAQNPGAPLRFLAAGRTMDSVEASIVTTAQQLFGRSNVRYKIGCMTLFGAPVDVVGANDERMASTIQGRTYAGGIIDELTVVPRNFFDMAKAQMSVSGSRLYVTCNPDGPHHWVMKDFIERATGWPIYSCKWKLSREYNPSLSEDYIADMHRTWPVNSVFYRRNILGEWCSAEGVVYDMFDGAVHVVKSIPRERVIESLIAVDYGTSNPFTAGIYEMTDDGRVYLSKEYWYDSATTGKQFTDEQYANALQKFIKENYWTGDTIVCDPSALSFITLLKQRGYNVQGGDNSIADGVRTVQTMLAGGRFFVHQSCTETIREFALYTWDTKKQAQGIDMPMKTNDHAMDRNRYALMQLRGAMGLTDAELEKLRADLPF